MEASGSQKFLVDPESQNEYENLILDDAKRMKLASVWLADSSLLRS